MFVCGPITLIEITSFYCTLFDKPSSPSCFTHSVKQAVGHIPISNVIDPFPKLLITNRVGYSRISQEQLKTITPKLNQHKASIDAKLSIFLHKHKTRETKTLCRHRRDASIDFKVLTFFPSKKI